ncbi:ABC transporter permease [Streptomyces sp. NPDC004610]|uniref:ABC transporter permease n=1 Tax=unclassified Streptomyces TaxID=2593676 RepID=UPI0033A74EF4
MSSTTTTMGTGQDGRDGQDGRGGRTTVTGRLGALARAELTLLGRSRATLVTAVFVPLVVPFSLRSAAGEMDLAEHGLDVGTMLLPAAIALSLLFAVYAALTGVFVVRREELVLKRLRTGELRDNEILIGASLPSLAIGLGQSVLLAAGCALLLDMEAPRALPLAILGVLLGLVLCAALGAVTASWTRTAESAQVTSLPLLFVSMLASGVAVPLEVLPDRIAAVCELLPLSPVVTLIRGGWTGALSAGEVLAAVATALAWTVLSVFAVRRWFRWEPRR